MYIERKARIKYHDSAFLNPNAIFLRDLSVAFVQSFARRGTRILDPTAATGIRGIRYYLETRAKDIAFLDINRLAAEMAKKNVRFNKMRKARVINKSIQEFANTTPEAFDIVDLDPFGSAAPYVYDLMKMAKDHEYLFVTATDTAVLCGAHEKACLKIYDAKPMHNELCQEIGIRILLGFIARVAAQFNYGIEVIFSLSYLHYMRVYVRLSYGADRSIQSVKNLGYAYYCSGCGFRDIERGTFPKKSRCTICDSQLIVAGKLWASSIENKKAVKTMLDYLVENKMDGNEIKTLSAVYNELDVPLFYSVPKLTKKMHLPSISPVLVLDKLRERGFAASRTHFDDSSIRTDADIKTINKLLNKL